MRRETAVSGGLHGEHPFRFLLLFLPIVLVIGACNEAAAPAPTPTPSWMSVWYPIRLGVGTQASRTPAVANDLLGVSCNYDFLPTQVGIVTHVRHGEREDLAESVDEIHLSLRAAGEEGRWIRNDWERRFYYDGGVMAVIHKPAAAFIRQLFEVEELAVRVTYHWGEATTATFDVRYLEEALSTDLLAWGCALSD